jgi:transcriptional regulator with XRE-family HTH domain
MFSDTWNKLRNKKYRDAFVFQAFKRIIPFQIYAMRKKRGWSQERLAEESNLTQGVVSRAEDQDYGNLTVNTICRIASGFDVAFIGKFVPFSELDKWITNLSEDSGVVPSFGEEEHEMFTQLAQAHVASSENELGAVQTAQAEHDPFVPIQGAAVQATRRRTLAA